jgi:Acetyltransferase (GNAT) domain/Acetyltransferase (GNAT) family
MLVREMNQIASDWSLFLQLNPAGCLVAEKNGIVVGTVANLRYGEQFSWLAMVLVDPRERRQGIGTRLLEQGLALAPENECVRLDATDAGRQLYRQYGFLDEYVIHRVAMHLEAPETVVRGGHARRVVESDLPEILALDRIVFGADREPVLRSLFARSPESAWVVADAGVEGYCFGRNGFLYRQIGPVVARNHDVAQELIAGCLTSGSRGGYVIDAPGHCKIWLAWLQEKGFRVERSFTRMFRGTLAHPGQPERVFGVAGPELG